MAGHRCSSFAQTQLEKHGWQAGQGLGRTESGISEAIKVKIKHDTAGVGHDLGQQFTYHWWDHVFNKAANNIVVENNQEGVKMTSKEKSHGPISNKKQPKNVGKKPLLYGNFVRSATLTAEGLKRDDQDSSSSEEEESNKEEMNIDEKFFKACGGRTAHKGARHGLKLSGKLKRIQEQEELEGYLNRQKDQAQSTKPSPPSLDKDQSQTTEDDDNDREKVRDAGDEEKQERKRQKKEKKRRMKAAIENGRCDDAGDEQDGENVLQESGSATEEEKHTTEQDASGCCEDDESERQREEKQRKKDRKRKRKEAKSANGCHEDTVDLDDTMVITINEADERKQARKARKELKLKNRQDGASCGDDSNGPFVNDVVELTLEENGDDQDRKRKKKKEKKRKMESVDVCENENNESSELICCTVPEGDMRTGDNDCDLDTKNGGDDLGKKSKKRRKEEVLQNGSLDHECTDIKTSKKSKKKKSKH
ncbi:uncharacterized protein [Asterias amurensis]|uniref:uncharacterized protein n=1 Tax=Asterias amurensis TaxID=7602 RepID=UPI003AB6A40D